jgi:hypothetical protein
VGKTRARDVVAVVTWAMPVPTNDTWPVPPLPLEACPPGVVTTIGPLVAPVGTVAVICVSELTVKEAVTPLNVTAVAPVRFVPVITTELPTAPLVGEKPVIVGGSAAETVKEVVLVAVPAGVVTAIAPVVAPVGTVAVICVAEFTVNAVAAVPLKETPLAPDRFVPVITTELPTAPLVGANELTVGVAAVTVKLLPPAAGAT